MTDENTETPTADEAVAQAIADATAGLKNKNTELLGKLKTQTAEVSDMKAQLDALAEANEAAETAAAEKAGDFSKVRAAMEAKHAAAMKEAMDATNAERAVNHKLLVDNGLNDALVSAGVSATYMPAVKALITSTNNIELVDVDGTRAAQINHQPLSEYVAAWAQGDAGKHFVSAPDNSGGGAQGAAGGKATGKTMTRAQFQGLNPAQQSQKAREGVTLSD